MIRLSGAAAIVSFIGGALGRVARNRGEASLASEEPWSARNQLPNVNVPVKPALGTRPEFKLEGTPLMINGVLYATAGTRRSVVALDAKTGELIWALLHSAP